MDFVFAKDDQIDWDSLRQGDILEKTEPLANAIREAHAYYAESEDYSHFLVLTQSCDLVKRGKKPPKSPYITIAAIKPLQSALHPRVDKYSDNGVEFPFKVCVRDNRILIDQFLERLLHNTEDKYFFLRAGSAPTIDRDSCVFLQLSIALRDTHYDVCLNSKVAQLDDIFAAKVGWLAGNLYSRIGTPDFEEHITNHEEYITNHEEYKKVFFEDVLNSQTVWLSPAQIKVLKAKVREWRKHNGVNDLSEKAARDMLKTVPDDLSMAIQRVVKLLTENKIIDNDSVVVESAKNILRNDKNLKKLIVNTDR